MQVTATELKINLGRILDSLTQGDVLITRNGRKVAKLIKIVEDPLAEMNSLLGIIAHPDISGMDNIAIREAIREERSKRYECSD